MKFWLRDLPKGAEVVVRQVRAGVVETVWGGDHGGRLFDARVGFETCHYDSGLIAVRDRPLLAKGARFWLVAESVLLADGAALERREIRFARPGIETAEQAFATGGEAQ